MAPEFSVHFYYHTFLQIDTQTTTNQTKSNHTMKINYFIYRSVALALVLMAGVLNNVAAQVSLIYPDGTPTATFTTIKAAYDSIYYPNHAGAHIIQLENSYNPSAETYPITLGAKIGASASNAVTIKPATGTKVAIGPANQTVIATVTGSTFAANASTTLDVNLTGLITSGSFSSIVAGSYISGIGTYSAAEFKKVSAVNAAANTITANIGAFTATSIAGNKLYIGPAQTAAFKLNGAKYVTIDGVSRTDVTTGLTIQNPNSIYAQTIVFTGNSQYNTVKNCIIRGANQTGAWNNGFQGTIYFQAGTGNTCSYNTIDSNDICDMNDPNLPYPICALQLTAAGGTNTNHTISNNNIYNYSNQYSNGTTCAAMQFGSEGASTGNAVLNNKIYWTAPATFITACNVVNCGTIGLNNRFEGNTIGYTSANGTGTADLTYTVSGGTIYVLSNIKNFTCKNNTIANIKVTSPNGAKAFVCFQIPAASSGATANADNCYGNTVKNIELNSNGGNGTLYGIMLPAAPIYNLDVKNNVVKNLTCQSTGATYTNTIYGLSANFNYSGTISINCIGNEFSNFTAGKSGSSAANVITGLVTGGCNVLFEKNLIYNLNTISTGTGSIIKGIRLTLSFADGKLIKNNIIKLGSDVTSDAEISAIYHEALSNGSHPFKMYHNSISISGTSQTKPSHCLSRAGAISGLITLQNNIFSNVRTGGSAVNQVYNLYAATDVTASDHNLYQYGSKFGTVTTTSATTYTTMSDWAAAVLPSLFEDGSLDQINPEFVIPTEECPNLLTVKIAALDGTGADLSAVVTDDFLGNSRTVGSFFGTSDIGAYAFNKDFPVAVNPIADSGLKLITLNNAILIKGSANKIAKIYAVDGTTVYAGKLSSDAETVSVKKGIYIVSIGSLRSKIRVQ